MKVDIYACDHQPNYIFVKADAKIPEAAESLCLSPRKIRSVEIEEGTPAWGVDVGAAIAAIRQHGFYKTVMKPTINDQGGR